MIERKEKQIVGQSEVSEEKKYVSSQFHER